MAWVSSYKNESGNTIDIHVIGFDFNVGYI